MEISDAEVDRRFRELAAYTVAEDSRVQAAVRYIMTGAVMKGETDDYLDHEQVSDYLEVRYGADGDLIMWAFSICERQFEERMNLGQA